MLVKMNEEDNELTRLGLSRTAKTILALGTISSIGDRDETPPGLRINMLDHQRLILAEMRKRENTTLVSTVDDNCNVHIEARNSMVLMEEIGSGKSYMILARILQQPKLTRPSVRFSVSSAYQKMHGYTASSSVFDTKFEKVDIVGNMNWIVVPHGIIHQWKEYLGFTSLSYVILNTTKTINDIDAHVDKQVWLIPSTKYNTIVNICRKKQNCTASRLIFDECDTIQIPQTQQHKSAFVWFISSSVQNMLFPSGTYDSRTLIRGVHSRGFIQDMLVASQNDAQNTIIKAPYNLVKLALQLVKPVEHILMVRNSSSVSALTGVVSGSISRMLNANDYSGVSVALDLDLSASEDEIVKKIVSNLKETLTERSTLKVREDVEKKIKIIETRFKEQDVCCICHNEKDEIKGLCVSPCCYSSWCMNCIVKWLDSKTSCPKCRADLYVQQLMTVGTTDVTSMHKSKDDAFIHVIRSNINTVRKLLIFTEFEGGTKKIESICKSFAIKAVDVKGRSDTIKKRIEQWENDKETSALLLNAQRFGAGLNLQSATDIIIWHRLGNRRDSGNSDLENQVIGRVIRLGALNSPNVWKLHYQSE
jgi:hypothetical protein